MAASSTTFKLGLLAILGLLASVVVVFALGSRGFREESVDYHTYFDESVSGLEVGAPVKYRGVAVGIVSALAITPDGRFVDVTIGIRSTALPKRLVRPDGDPGLRAQLNSQGITGVKLIDIDFFDPKTHRSPPLPFEPPKNYLPATPSLLGVVQRGLEGTANRLPEVTNAILETLAQVRRIFEELEGQRIPTRLGATIEDLHGAVGEVRVIVRNFRDTRLPEKAAAALEHLDKAVSNIAHVVERVDGDAGLVVATQRATETVATLGRGMTGATQDLDRTLRDLGEAARAVREVADELERDPDMLVKGRAPTRGAR